MARRLAALIAAVALAGCAHPDPVRTVETVEVRVPVPVRADPPAALMAPLDAAPPVFVAPSDPGASSALTAEGERALKVLLAELVARVEAWRAWAAPEMKDQK